LETAYAVRQILMELDIPADGICGILLHATGKKPTEREMASINTYATLSELSHYSRPESIYPGDADHGLRPCGPGKAPFEDCYLVHLGDCLDESEAVAATDVVAEYLALDCSPDGGAFLDQYRRNTSGAGPEGEGTSLRVFGLQRMGAVRDYLADRAAAVLCL